MRFESDVSFHPDIRVLFSAVKNGSMAAPAGTSSVAEHTENVALFLKQHELPIAHVRLLIRYETESTYDQVRRVSADDHGQTVAADALYTTDPSCIMTLPVADCVATVVYDPISGMRGLLHLGRHSSMSGLIEAFVIDVADTIGSDPRDWYIWMSPSICQHHDKLEFFEPPKPEDWNDFMKHRQDGIHINTVGHNMSRFVRAGVQRGRITISPECTYDDVDFYSHRAYTETNNMQKQGRMAAVVATKPPEELLQY